MTDAFCRPLAFMLTGGQVPDCFTAGELLDQLVSADILHGDKGYDSDAVRRKIESKGAAPNIMARTCNANEPRAWIRKLAAIGLLASVPCAASAASVEDLLRAYPDALIGVDGSDLIWRDGTRMPLEDGVPYKSIEEQLRDGSILDQLGMAYPKGADPEEVPQQDPGRVRNQAFFDKMYGDCRAGEVAPKLAPVVWLPKTWGHTVRITSVNGVNRILAEVSRELDELPSTDKKYLYPIGGTYICRRVADTGEMSMHGWGAAIDINPAFSDYWLWHRTGAGPLPYTNRIPPEIVSVFERHGFIWGGRWAHFDTMHFEYRPELLGFDPRSEE